LQGANTHVHDTVVMSNLGYFQLMAAPGVWDLRLAPGRHSRVFDWEVAPSSSSTSSATSSSLASSSSDSSSSSSSQSQGSVPIALPVTSFQSDYFRVFVQRRAGMEAANLDTEVCAAMCVNQR
jgi:UDP-glucose:glycoprotein glucosyltransferase